MGKELKAIKMDFKSQYDAYLKIVNSQIDKYFCGVDIPQKTVFDAMEYTIKGGGKRIRPVLLMATADICNADFDDASRVSVAIECIHNYSLIHDDLPCMDDDDLRRGRATCHKVFGEDIAVLAGDGLLNFAFEILSDCQGFNKLEPADLIEIIKDISSASGVYGMIGGQVVDIESENRNDVTLDELLYLHKNKTGAIIASAARCGCLCGGFKKAKDVLPMIEAYAEKIGLAFQIKDDLLDVTGDTNVLGKTVGSDEKSDKTTFVKLLGQRGAEEYLEKVTEEAKSAIAPISEKAEFLYDFADFLLNRNY